MTMHPSRPAQPITVMGPIRNTPTNRHTSNNASNNEHDEDDDNDFGAVEDLTEQDIEMLRAAAASSIDAQAGKNILRHPHLDDAPDPSNIKDVNSSVLGDAFHVMDRSKIPKVHEAKKRYLRRSSSCDRGQE